MLWSLLLVCAVLLLVLVSMLPGHLPEQIWLDHPEIYIPGGIGAVALIALLCKWIFNLPTALRARKGGVLEPIQLEELMPGQSPIIVDLRPQAEFFGKHGHIRNSRSIPFPELLDHVDEIEKEARGKPVVLVDETDELSHKARPMLEAKGITWIYVLQGGFRAWRAQRLPVYPIKP